MSVKLPKNIIYVLQVQGNVLALWVCVCIWVLLSFIESLCLLLENNHLVSVFLCEGYFASSLSKLFSLPFFLKNPVIKKDLREGKFTYSSFPPRFFFSAASGNVSSMSQKSPLSQIWSETEGLSG